MASQEYRAVARVEAPCPYCHCLLSRPFPPTCPQCGGPLGSLTLIIGEEPKSAIRIRSIGEQAPPKYQMRVLEWVQDPGPYHEWRFQFPRWQAILSNLLIVFDPECDTPFAHTINIKGRLVVNGNYPIAEFRNLQERMVRINHVNVNLADVTNLELELETLHRLHGMYLPKVLLSQTLFEQVQA